MSVLDLDDSVVITRLLLRMELAAIPDEEDRHDRALGMWLWAHESLRRCGLSRSQRNALEARIDALFDIIVGFEETWPEDNDPDSLYATRGAGITALSV